MKKILLMLTLLIGLTLQAQTYSIYSHTKGVKVESGGKSVDATDGMPLKPNDMLVIPANGSVSVHDKNSGDIFTSVSTGKISVTKLKIEASRKAASKGESMLSGMKSRFGDGGAVGGSRVYKERGMVNRSLTAYDPEGDGIEMAPGILAAYIAGKVLNRKYDGVPLDLAYGEKGDGGLFFNLHNTLDYPVYFNVLKIAAGEGNEVEISPLGQPNGTYVVLPRQAIRREHFDTLPVGETHVVVVTPCQFDLDAVIEQVNTLVRNPEAIEPAEEAAVCVVRIK